MHPQRPSSLSQTPVFLLKYSGHFVTVYSRAITFIFNFLQQEEVGQIHVGGPGSGCEYPDVAGYGHTAGMPHQNITPFFWQSFGGLDGLGLELYPL